MAHLGVRGKPPIGLRHTDRAVALKFLDRNEIHRTKNNNKKAVSISVDDYAIASYATSNEICASTQDFTFVDDIVCQKGTRTDTGPSASHGARSPRRPTGLLLNACGNTVGKPALDRPSPPPATVPPLTIRRKSTGYQQLIHINLLKTS
jgi:hypothetical protein